MTNQKLALQFSDRVENIVGKEEIALIDFSVSPFPSMLSICMHLEPSFDSGTHSFCPVYVSMAKQFNMAYDY